MLRTLATTPELQACLCDALASSEGQTQTQEQQQHQQQQSEEGGEEEVEVEQRQGGLCLYKGKPGERSGHLVEASSYFDR